MADPAASLLDPEDQGRSARKRRAILDAAASAFLSKGYLGTSMDEIAALAQVSKQTVYKHFTDKQSLFIELVTGTVNEISDPVYDEVVQLANSGDLEADLRDLARRLVARVMQPRLLELRRLVIAEASRFPELGRAFYERGPGRTISALAVVFEQLGASGALQLDDHALAAAHFNWLIMSAPLNQAMMLGNDSIPGLRELNRHADAGVRAFLAAYRGR
jgi:AcrR family transcriptional regulator